MLKILEYAIGCGVVILFTTGAMLILKRFSGTAGPGMRSDSALGSGERLFEGTGNDLHGLTLVRTVATPSVIHLKFARR